MELNTESWKEYKIVDLFCVSGTKTTPLEELEEFGKGNFPYITTQSINNGTENFYNHYTENKNVLTIDSAVLGTCFYQNKNFTASDHIEKLKSKDNHFNEYVGLFFATIINKENYKYSYGRKYNQNRIKNTIINLPTKNNQPDFDFMEQYIKEIYKKYEEKIKTNNLTKPTPKLEVEKWKEFRVGDIFKQNRGKESAPNQNEEGEIIMINETRHNNGATRKVEPTKIFNESAITISINFASIVFYQPTKFCASVNIAILRNQNLNKYNALFLCSILKETWKRYDYGYKISKDKINDTIISLPHTTEGEPDWQFMEDYIKSLPCGDKI